MNGLIPEAYAQAGGAAPGGQLAPLLMMVLFILILRHLNIVLTFTIHLILCMNTEQKEQVSYKRLITQNYKNKMTLIPVLI